MMPRFAPLLPIILVLLLAACAAPTQRGAGVPDAAELEQAMAAGRYPEAAVGFWRLGHLTEGDESRRIMLRTAEAYGRAGNLHQAREILKSLRLNPADPAQAFLQRLTQATIALGERRPEDVLNLLAEPPPSGMDPWWLADYHDLRADAYTMLGNRLETARELVQRETYLRDPDLIAANQNDIWQALSMMSERALQQLRTEPPPDVLSGWMELVQISKQYQLQPTLLHEAVLEWKQRYPGHPARAELIEELLSRKAEHIVIPERIAVLLPLSGRFARAGEALRDGILAAYYTRRARPEQVIRIYDTESSPDILDLYRQAVSDGAGFVIGPLNKTRIQRLVQYGDLSVPTLALNYIPDEENIPPRLFQFGLSPEEEARQVAERTWLDGYVNAAVLVPAGPWGERVAKAFNDRWTEIGGTVVEQQTYNAARNDYSGPIRKLLNIDESERRYRAMRHLLNQTIKYTPRRRKDIDFIFLAAYPRQARQIRPQLKFYHAADVPVYATSHVFTGNLNPERDRDMDGLRFGDMPWVLTGTTTHRGLRTEVEPYISKAGNRLQRLYALGIDSYRIIGALSTLKQYPYQRYDGETGSLSLDAKQRIHRQLIWVRFRSGRPMPLDDGL